MPRTGGFMPAHARTDRDDPYRDVPKAMDFMREGVEGYGEALKPHLLREIGTALGGLNSIGALRSGGSKVALEDITTNYGQQIGAFAKQATSEGLGYGLEAGQIRDRRADARRARQGGLLKSIGGVIGAGIGFFTGGPAGAVAGYGAGSSLGGGGKDTSGAYK